jgi:hypothetical protein
MKKIANNATYWLSVVAIGLVVGLSLQFVSAWVEPTQTAPNGNVGSPVNTSVITQIKQGAFGVVGAFSAFSGIDVATRNPVDNSIIAPHKITGVETPTDDYDAVNKKYVDAASGGGTKIIKGSGGSFDCGSGWKIKRCGCGGSTNAGQAQAVAVQSYMGSDVVSGSPGCTFVSFDSQTGSCNMSAFSVYAYIAECYK